MSITYVYTKLQTSLARLAIVALLEKHSSGLESLAEDLGMIIKNNVTSELYTASSMLDYADMLLEDVDGFEGEFDFHEGIRTEFQEIINEVITKLQYYQARMRMKPRAIHLEFPNILIIEYPSPEEQEPIQVPKFVLEKRHRRERHQKVKAPLKIN